MLPRLNDRPAPGNGRAVPRRCPSRPPFALPIFARGGPQMPMRSHRFVPRLQALDERALPSVSYDLQGTFLFVTGDAGANAITITDSGTDSGVTVVGDGLTYVATTPITHVFVDTQDGDDTVVYNLT